MKGVGVLLLCGGLLLSPAQASDDLLGRTVGVAQSTWNEVLRLGGLGGQATPLATDLELPPDAGPPKSFQEVWRQLTPKLEGTLDLQEEMTSLPPSTWFGRDQVQAQRQVDRLLDEAIGILGISEAQHFRDHIRDLQQQIRNKREEISQARRERVSAPQESLWRTTVADYDKRIERLQEQIRKHEQELLEIRGRFTRHLQQIGLDLEEEQLEFLLSTVVGEDIIQMGIAFDNVRLMTLQLEKLVDESQEEMEMARRYYGMYTVLLRVIDQMYGHLIEQIDRDYLPKIDSIIARAQSLNQETGELLKKYPERSEILRSNQASQQLTLKASGLYRRYLQEQRRDVMSARQRLNEDMLIANNTYDTVRVSGELISVVRNSRHLLETLGRMQVPTLRGFENLEMKREFERLTTQMRGLE